MNNKVPGKWVKVEESKSILDRGFGSPFGTPTHIFVKIEPSAAQTKTLTTPKNKASRKATAK